MCKYLIVGSNGYLGKNLAYYLTQLGKQLDCIDIQDRPSEQWMRYRQIDITDEEIVNSLSLEYDIIYFFAGLTGTAVGFENFKAFNNVNINGLQLFLRRLSNLNFRGKIIFPSTRLVYKGEENRLVNEESPKEPKTIYALNKLYSEQMLALYADVFNINYVVFRICVPYGSLLPTNRSYGTIGLFREQAATKRVITVYGSGELRRTFTHVKDICSVLSMVNGDLISENQIYNLGGDHFSLIEIAEMIAKSNSATIEHIPWPKIDSLIESGDTMFCDAKLSKQLGVYRTESLIDNIL